MPDVYKGKAEYDPDGERRLPVKLRKMTNQSFIIQVIYPNKETRLRGAGTIYREVGHTMARKMIDKAFKCPHDKYSRKFPNGMRINFFSK